MGVARDVGVEFRAGRNGQVLRSVTCYSQDPYAKKNSGNPARVTWNGTGLSCSEWDP